MEFEIGHRATIENSDGETKSFIFSARGKPLCLDTIFTQTLMIFAGKSFEQLEIDWFFQRPFLSTTMKINFFKKRKMNT